MTLREQLTDQRVVFTVLALIWLPIVTTLVFGPSVPTLVASVIAALALAVMVSDDDVRDRARRLFGSILVALSRLSRRVSTSVAPRLPVRKVDPLLARSRIRAISLSEPRAPTQEAPSTI